MSQMARDLMLDFVVQTMLASKVEITLDSVKQSALLPDDFFPPGSPDEDAAEVAAAVKRISAEIAAVEAEAHPEETFEPAQESVEVSRPDADGIIDGQFTEIAAQPEPQPDAETEVEQAPRKSLIEAQDDLARAQHDVRNALERQKRARHVLADAILKFQIAYGAALTPEQLRHDFAKSEHAARQSRAGQLGSAEPQAPRANTYIDRANGRGGSADDFVRQNLRHGGHRRGAMPSSAYGVYDPRADKRLQKLPSDR